MTDLTLYHNPRCSKSRGALELLEARGLTPTVVRYLETPLDAAQIKALLKKLGISARQLLRTGEDEYKALNLADAGFSEAQLIAAIAEHPKLMERPILATADKAIIGRPPENVLEILP
ncbi:arsenate reductase (glutaredoxin) [Pseudomonas paralactis]|uniref:Arsenate reductase n=1 Tax=Pseudomonas paralactis TaxID=1615673 RepID=A0A0R3AJ29_9PSED|nr:arsenate reductase (glutaredoxin) [Pseudomonas paralactis]KRP71012.1 arsenate reductase [Pseudomonas paralactis]MBI6635691.1 arsenate reductase (glutaredoxin) [Pseudomonas paralactis]